MFSSSRKKKFFFSFKKKQRERKTKKKTEQQKKMGPTDKFIMRFLLFLCISSVFINVIYITNILTTTTERRLAEENYPTNDPSNGLLHENRDIEIFGSTGHLFTGEKTRRYEGKRASFSTTFHQEKDKINQPKTRSCTRWGVVTTIFDLSESIIKVGRLADFLALLFSIHGKNFFNNYSMQILLK